MKEIVSRLHENRQLELAKSILENAGYTIAKCSHTINEMSTIMSRTLAERIFDKLQLPLPEERNVKNKGYIIQYPGKNLVIYAEENIRLPAKDVVDINHVNSVRFDSSASDSGENLVPQSLIVKPASTWSDEDVRSVTYILLSTSKSLGIDLSKPVQS